MKLPSGAVRQVEPDWAGKLSGFTLLFLLFRVVRLSSRVTRTSNGEYATITETEEIALKSCQLLSSVFY